MWYLLAGQPTFHYNLVGVQRTTVADQNKLESGKHTIVVDFKYDGPGVGKSGTATLLVDGKEVASGNIPRTIPFRISADETLDFGEDTGTPVSEDYKVPFKFSPPFALRYGLVRAAGWLAPIFHTDKLGKIYFAHLARFGLLYAPLEAFLSLPVLD
jgi:hypothetical protein